ncbi:MAG: hypothetical protein IIA58_03045 [Candidatus Marinimicrobia bacterium]|nr:hypothetical protein [Candidatus Neomarinimicrobiota bacterium]
MKPEIATENSEVTVVDISAPMEVKYKLFAEIRSILEYSPTLIEEAVMRFISDREEETVFRDQRNALYEIEDTEQRDSAFQNFHLFWFAKLALDTPLVESLCSYPFIISKVDRVAIVQAPAKKKEGAELFRKNDKLYSSDEKNTSILITLTPEQFRNTDRLLDYLRHELQHIEDILNPDFGYKIDSSDPKVSSLIDSLFLQRYSVLWDLTVDGRLSNKEFQTSLPKKIHFEKFQQTFQLPLGESSKLFDYFFDNPNPMHEKLVDFVVDPLGWLKDRKDAKDISKGNCSLCTFSSTDLSVIPKLFSEEIIELIQKENLDWKLSDPVCGQCIDIYESRLTVTGLLE